MHLSLGNVCIYPTPPLQAGCDTRFSSSETSCLAKAKDPSLPYYLPVAGGRTDGFMCFPSMTWNTNSFIQDLNSDNQFHFFQLSTIILYARPRVVVLFLIIFQSYQNLKKLYKRDREKQRERERERERERDIYIHLHWNIRCRWPRFEIPALPPIYQKYSKITYLFISYFDVILKNNKGSQ